MKRKVKNEEGKGRKKREWGRTRKRETGRTRKKKMEHILNDEYYNVDLALADKSSLRYTDYKDQLQG